MRARSIERFDGLECGAGSLDFLQGLCRAITLYLGGSKKLVRSVEMSACFSAGVHLGGNVLLTDRRTYVCTDA